MYRDVSDTKMFTVFALFQLIEMGVGKLIYGPNATADYGLRIPFSSPALNAVLVYSGVKNG